MKWFARILILYFLFLQLTPCCAYESCKEDTTQGKKAEQKNSNDDCGTCSPFFSCNSCAAIPLPADFIVFDAPATILISKYPSLPVLGMPSAIAGYWQPPRLS